MLVPLVGFLVLPAGGAAEVDVYDVRGSRLRRLQVRELTAGRHPITWDGRNENGQLVASGIYFARLHTPTGDARARFALVR